MTTAEALIPPDDMIRENSGGIDRATYLAMGDSIVEHSLVGHGGLKPDGAVLDIGCGCAKIARPLSEYLNARGSYVGIDIGRECIDWCQAAYRDKPNFRFHYADVFSSRYHTEGRHHAATYRVPVESGSIDAVFLGSVFTHLIPDEVENYLDEIARVLKPGGFVLATYFILDDESRANVEAGRTSPAFGFQLGDGSGCRVELREMPEAAIAFEERFIRKAYGRTGLEITAMNFGKWGRGPDLAPHWQDEVWARKPKDSSPIRDLTAELRRAQRWARLRVRLRKPALEPAA